MEREREEGHIKVRKMTDVNWYGKTKGKDIERVTELENFESEKS